MAVVWTGHPSKLLCTYFLVSIKFQDRRSLWPPLPSPRKKFSLHTTNAAATYWVNCL
uniref:Uncharacterized protein n=1 Tax=Arundo donax TaxID=35708 RepID=A0A0A9EAM0_ARUDO